MKKVLIGFVLLSLVLASMVLVACGEEETTTSAGATQTTAAGEMSALDAVIAAAEEEGTVLWNVGGMEVDAATVQQGIKDMFGVDIEVQAVPGDLREDIAQMLLEQEAGQPLSFDLLNSGAPQILKDLVGLHAKVDWETLVADAGMDSTNSAVDKVVGDPINSIVGYGDAYCWIYNTDMITDPATEIPAKVADLVNPEWNGKFGYVKFGGPVVTVCLSLGLDQQAAADFVLGLIANGGVQGKYDEVAASVSLGEYPFGLSAIKEYTAIKAKDPAAPIGYALTEDVMYISQATFSVVEGCEHPNAATLLALWLYSSDGAAFLAEAGGYASYTDPNTDLGALLQMAMDKNLTITYECDNVEDIEWQATDDGKAYETAVNDAIHSADPPQN